MSRRTDRVDTSAMSGAFRLAYGWPSALMEWKRCNTPVPVSAWRSVYASQNVFATEGFLDEVAIEAGKDPLQFRLDLLTGDPRLQRCLETAASAIGWGRSLPAGRGLGIACCHVFGSRVAQAVDAWNAPSTAAGPSVPTRLQRSLRAAPSSPSPRPCTARSPIGTDV
jgi:isoquinoline 1-oxidoreductase beta subunit